MKPIVIFFFALLSCLSDVSYSQTMSSPGLGEKKGSLFLYWGYNRSWFSNSNLHFNGPDYDFTVYDLKSIDRPTPFGTVYFNPTTFTIPQYNYRLGYFINDRLVVSGGIDHMKYVIVEDQPTTLSGVISSRASDTWAGAYLNEPIQLQDDLLQFEHSDGLNFVSLDFEYLQPLFSAWKNKLDFYWNAGFGGFWMVTKSKVKVLGDGLDNDFHVAGYSMAGKTGPRIELLGRFFVLSELKGGYASLPSVLVKNSAPQIGDHNFTFLEWYTAVGVNFRLAGRRKKQDHSLTE